MIRTVSARVECDQETLLALWHTHVVFHERLLLLVDLLFAMRRGECGATTEARALYRRVGHFITGCSSQHAPYLFNAVSIRGWKPTSAKSLRAKVVNESGVLENVGGDSWAEAAATLSAAGILLFDKREVLGDLPPALQQVVAREAAAVVSAYASKARSWPANHFAWLAAKEAWERSDEHLAYLALRPRFEAFEIEAGGSLTGRRRRWPLYVDWLKANADLAAWRGGPPRIVEPDAAALDRVRRAGPTRRTRQEAEEFWAANLELAALDRIHGEYEKRFVRRRKAKRNVDGFDHRPTFTRPDPVLHPRWMLFNGPNTNPRGYRHLEIPVARHRYGSVELRVLVARCGESGGSVAWVPLRFKADARMSDLRETATRRAVRRGSRAGEEVAATAYTWTDRKLGIDRPASLRGARLVFDLRGGRPTAAYLRFTLDVENVAVTQSARAIGWVSISGPPGVKPRLRKTLPDGLVTAAVHLGLRHLAFATLAIGNGETPTLLRSRNLWIGHAESGGRHPGRWSEGPTVGHSTRHGDELRRRRSLTGRPVAGERGHVELRRHIERVREDRYKKVARLVIDFARNASCDADATGTPYPAADVLIIPDLAILTPSADREARLNRALAEFARGRLTGRIAELAADVGLRVFEVPVFGTASVCNRCGAVGRRYGIGKDRSSGSLQVEFGPAGVLFACPACEYSADAAHNASCNLHRWFYSPDAVAAMSEFASLGVERRRSAVEEAERRILEFLAARLGAGLGRA